MTWPTNKYFISGNVLKFYPGYYRKKRLPKGYYHIKIYRIQILYKKYKIFLFQHQYIYLLN